MGTYCLFEGIQLGKDWHVLLDWPGLMGWHGLEGWPGLVEWHGRTGWLHRQMNWHSLADRHLQHGLDWHHLSDFGSGDFYQPFFQQLCVTFHL